MKQRHERASRRAAVLGVATVVSLVVAGCGGGGDGGASSSANQAAASVGKPDPNDKCTADKVDPHSTLTVSVSYPTQSLDPIEVPGGYAGGSEAAAIYDTLMRYNPDTAGFDPFVASSLTSNADSTEWTLKLRPGIKFGNGDPLTAKDVQYSVTRMKTAKVAAAAYANLVGPMDVVDDLTIVFHLTRPWGGFATALAGETGMVVSRRAVEAGGVNFASNPVGAGVGAFEPVKLAPGDQTLMKVKTHYWGGPVCIGNLKFVSVPKARAAFEAFQKGEVNVVSLQDPRVTHDFEQSANVKELSALLTGRGVSMNSRPDSPFSDVRLRQAVAAAINPDVINRRAFAGYGVMSSSLAAPGMRINPGTPGPAFDLEKAKKLVADAKAAGVNTSVTLLCADQFSQDYVLAIQALLNQAGFDVKTQIVSTPENLARLQAGSFQLNCGTMLTLDDAPLRQLGQLTSDSPANRLGFKNADLDAAIKDLYRAKTPDEIKNAMGKVQGVWNQVVPMALVYADKLVVGFKENVRGVYLGNDAKTSFEKAYIAK